MGPFCWVFDTGRGNFISMLYLSLIWLWVLSVGSLKVESFFGFSLGLEQFYFGILISIWMC